MRQKTLMHAYQAGDEHALEEIYITFKQPLYSFIYRFTQDEQLSTDTVQDTFMKLQRYKDHYNACKGHLKSYLFQIAYHLMVAKLNRRKKLKRLIPFIAPMEQTPSYDPTDLIAVREAVASLPYIQRAVIILFYYHDLSQKEIAQILNIPLGTVKSRLHVAIKKLKQKLEGNSYEGKSDE